MLVGKVVDIYFDISPRKVRIFVKLTIFASFGVLTTFSYMLIAICIDLFSGSMHKCQKWLSKSLGTIEFINE